MTTPENPENSTPQRVCRNCGVSLTDQNWTTGQRKIRNYICRSCDAARCRAWRGQNRERHRAWRQKWYKQNADLARAAARRHRESLRKKVLDLYGSACACCGLQVSFLLDLDHVNGGGQKQRKEMGSYRAIYTKLLAGELPMGDYQLLCRNCNWAKHLRGGCTWHRPQQFAYVYEAPENLALSATQNG